MEGTMICSLWRTCLIIIPLKHSLIHARKGMPPVMEVFWGFIVFIFYSSHLPERRYRRTQEVCFSHRLGLVIDEHWCYSFRWSGTTDGYIDLLSLGNLTFRPPWDLLDLHTSRLFTYPLHSALGLALGPYNRPSSILRPYWSLILNLHIYLNSAEYAVQHIEKDRDLLWDWWASLLRWGGRKDSGKASSGGARNNTYFITGWLVLTKSLSFKSEHLQA